jgi:hypothetical protein
VNPEEPAVRAGTIERKGWILSGALLAASLAFRSSDVTGGVALGAALVLLNFRWLRRFVKSLVSSGERKPGSWGIFIYLLKYLFAGVAIFVGIKYHVVDAYALLAGVPVIFPAICWEGISAHRKTGEGAYHAEDV